jgi:hypothetical protein
MEGCRVQCEIMDARGKVDRVSCPSRVRKVVSTVLGALALTSLAGCAGVGTRGASTPSARALYVSAETRVQEGHYNDAALLMRHALLKLPADESGDHLRHELVLRIAYVEMLAWANTGNHTHLEDARQMLLRYLERHEALFGHEGKAQRADVYEILHEVERRLESPTGEPDELAQTTATSRSSSDATRETVPADDDGGETRRAGKGEEATDDREVRVVRVRRWQPPDVDDPRVRAQLRGAFFNAEHGPLLTAPGWVVANDARTLVRLGGTRAVENDTFEGRRTARALGRSLVRSTRDDLARCFDGAFARQPTTSAESVVELSVHPDGRVDDVRIIDGSIVDGHGDACVIERLEGTRLDTDDIVASRVRMHLEFIHQDRVYVHELTGASTSFPSRHIPPRSLTAPRGARDRADPHRPVGEGAPSSE